MSPNMHRLTSGLPEIEWQEVDDKIVQPLLGFVRWGFNTDLIEVPWSFLPEAYRESTSF